MSCGCNNKKTSYIYNLRECALNNRKHKETLIAGDLMKISLMSVDCYGELGAEVHEDEDQLIVVACGSAIVKIGCACSSMQSCYKLCAGESVFIPAGMWHNVCNAGNGSLKLYSVYAKAQDWDNDYDCGCDSGC